MDDLIISLLAEKLNAFIAQGLPDLNNCFLRVKYAYPGISQEKSALLLNLHPFQRQIELKRIVGGILNGHYDNQEINGWIVHKWGCTRFNVNDQNRINNFVEHLNEGQVITDLEFFRISSLSKIVSFVSRENYFVFDSRVAYSLDGLLLEIQRERPELQVSFFPLPSARGNRSVEMRNRIQRIYPGADFFPYSRAYMEYNDLIPRLREQIEWAQDVPAFGVEMLLFVLGRTGGKIEERMKAFDEA